MRLAAAVATAIVSFGAGSIAAYAALATPRDLAQVVLPSPAIPGPAVQPYVSVSAPVVALTHVRVIDGTGGTVRDDQTIVIEAGKIAAIGGNVAVPAGARVIELSGHTVFPGLVGMHDHFFYIARPNLDANMKSDPPRIVPEMTFSAPRLYLADGVTTLRTTGSVEPYTDLNLKHAIDAGKLPGPHMDVTGPISKVPIRSLSKCMPCATRKTRRRPWRSGRSRASRRSRHIRTSPAPS